MLWFRAPEKVYFKKGCLPVALDELEDRDGQEEGASSSPTPSCIKTATPSPSPTSWTRWASSTPRFYDVAPDPTLACAKEGADGHDRLRARLHHRHRRRFRHGRRQDHVGACTSIRKRTSWTWPCASWISASACTPSRRWAKRRTSSPSPPPPAPAPRSPPLPSSPIEDTGVKYPLADYELLPKMAIVDADMMMNAPKGLTSRLRHRRRDPRPGSLRLHDGHRLHRRPGLAGAED